MREIGQKIRIRPESSDIISEIVGIYPAGQQGRNYHEYVINFEGQKIRLKASVVDSLFEEVGVKDVDKNKLSLPETKPSEPEVKHSKPQKDKPQTKKMKKGK